MDAMKNTPGRRYAYMVLGLIVLGWLVMDFNSRMNHLTRIRAERELVSENLLNVEETRVALEEAISYASSDRIVEEYSYIDAHKKRRGDYPIILLPDVVHTPTPTPLPVIIVEEQNNVGSWMSLFRKSTAP